jgi:hypothetical protein
MRDDEDFGFLRGRGGWWKRNAEGAEDAERGAEWRLEIGFTAKAQRSLRDAEEEWEGLMRDDEGFGLQRIRGGLVAAKRGGRGGRREKRGVEIGAWRLGRGDWGVEIGDWRSKIGDRRLVIEDWIYRGGAKVAEGRGGRMGRINE